jgi:hypothetical protein
MKKQEISIINQLVDMSDKDISTTATNTAQGAVDEGNGLNMLSLANKALKYFETIKGILSKHDSVLNELRREDNDKVILNKVHLSIAEYGTVWDFSATPWIAQQESDLKTWKERIDEIKEMAKKTPTKREHIIVETGELIIIMPAGKSSTTSIKCSIK